MIKFGPEALERALYNATDLLQRCLLDFVLLKDTARDVKAGPERLNESDAVYIGIEAQRVVPEVVSNLRTFASNRDLHYGMEDYQETSDGFEWKHGGVPIKIKVIHRKYGFIHNPDIKFFRLEEYRIPNPWEKYWKARFLVK